MKKKFIKLNNNDNNLSLGNIIRYVKSIANNKLLATQTEIFCIIFNVEDANDSTVNNYCIGYRSIGLNYKQIYNNYKSNFELLIPNIINLLSIMDNRLYEIKDNKTNLNLINNNSNLKKLINILYNISKNDNDVSYEFSTKIKKNIDNNNLYDAIKSILIFAILEKKQPIYIDNIVKNAIENLINNTNISINDLENFLNIEFMDGINYTYKIKQLAIDNNPYALFNLAMMEYNGEFSGIPRYNKCYEYLKKASISGHPRANFMIANLIYNNKIGNKSDEDLSIAWKHLNIAKDAGSIAAINTMGLAYLNGLVPNEKKDINKAISLFIEATNYDYTYAYNNLGKIYEKNKDYEKAYNYYLQSANLEESWACNKVGLHYLKNNNYKEAYNYFIKGIDAPIKNQCYWNKYNLAKYFYLKGCYEANVEQDINKAISLLTEITDYLIEASILLFYIAIDNNNRDMLLYYKDKIEQDKNFNNKIKKEIEDKLSLLSQKKIDTSMLLN